jgi:pimeloyl-ACP methyl ester carboxylesterase
MALAACAAFIVNPAATEPAAPCPGQSPAGFTSALAEVQGSSLHFVRGGSGPAVILIHGFPEDWATYQAIMPRLAQHFTVVTVDLPGIGRSAPPPDGHAAANVADQIHGLADALRLDRPYVLGHDLGAHVAYAYVRRFPEALRGAMILDTPIPGLAGSDEATSGLWHIGFMQTSGLPETLVPGRQSAFLGWFLDLGKFTLEQRDYYVQAYGADQLHAAFDMFRALPRNSEWNAQTGTNAVPLVAVGEKSFFSALLPTFIEQHARSTIQ